MDDTTAAQLNSEERIERLVIEQTVAQIFGINNCDLRRATRGRAHVARARQVGMYLAHVACGKSLTDVGRLFARDRTTVSHACSVIEDGRDDPTFDHVLELLERAVLAMIPSRLGRPRQSAGWLVH
ncbi:MAG: chromosomal replication initiator DnaA [Hyphomicrobiaceae bacterium]|nr:chromosomal replication initiator DnaA [Hyphomicrobiaceae bacterium]